MSLQVWLPLNGDLHNQGLNPVTVTNNGATVNNNGKIGKCYYFNGSSQYLQLNESLGNIYSGDFSWAVWLKPTDDTRGIIISEYSSTGSSNVAFELLANRVIRVYWNASPDWQFTSIPKDTWSHVAITKHIDTIKVYINGIESGNKTTTLSSRTSTAKIRIGDDYRGGTSVSYMGYMNDIRIYNHCLSAKEIKELAQGLVLHYKFNNKYNEGTTNLITSLTSGGQTTVSNGIVTTSGTNADTYFTLNLSESITEGTTYTISCDASIPDGLQWCFPLGWQNNSGYQFWISNGHNEYTFTANSGNWGTNRLFLDDNNSSVIRASGYSTTMWNFQLEKKDHATGYAGVGGSRVATTIYDSSGYGNNGTIVGSLTTSTPSPRYSCATKFDGSSYIKCTPFNFSTGNWTVSFWYYRTAQPSAYEGFICLSKGNGVDANKKFAAMPNNGYIWFKTESGSGTLSSLKTNTWTHIVITSEGKVYEDGVLKLSLTPGTVLTDCTDLVIGARAAASGVTSVTTLLNNSNLSDVRIYATALTPEQIKELYNTSMSIDNNGNIHARELVEL